MCALCAVYCFLCAASVCYALRPLSDVYYYTVWACELHAVPCVCRCALCNAPCAASYTAPSAATDGAAGATARATPPLLWCMLPHRLHHRKSSVCVWGGGTCGMRHACVLYIAA